jgi:hypothetical protein
VWRGELKELQFLQLKLELSSTKPKQNKLELSSTKPKQNKKSLKEKDNLQSSQLNMDDAHNKTAALLDLSKLGIWNSFSKEKEGK